MCRHDNQNNENGAYYVSRNVVREDSKYNLVSRNYFGGEYQNA